MFDNIDKFNKTVKELSNIYYNLSKSIDAESVKTKINIVINTNPDLLINEIGEYIFIFKDYIKDNKIDEVIMNHETILKKHKKITDKLSELSNNYISILNELRKYWDNMSPTEKKVISKKFKTLLSEFVKYKKYMIENS